MASLNKVILIGNLVADPELKKTQNDIPVTSFRIAVSRKYTKAGETPQADFIDIVCWRQQAEFVTKYFTKGKPILVCGALHSRTWTDANNQKRSSLEVVADDVGFVERRSSSEGSTMSVPRDSYQPDVPNYGNFGGEVVFEELSSDDELPF
jgi:single-strand DNA-binding protein